MFSHLSLEPATTVDRVADELRRALFEGELEPGTPLREVALAESLDVSRSTVREALGLLVSEGLAQRIPNRGTIVRSVDAAEIRDVCAARLVLEGAGIARWNDADEEAREGVRAAMSSYAKIARDRPTTAAFNAAHVALHRSFVALTGSPRLVAMAESLYAEIQLALARVDRNRKNATEQVRNHACIVDLLEAGKVSQAGDAIRAHLADAETSILEDISRVDAS